MKQNKICCCGPKIWTRVTGWLGMIIAVGVAILRYLEMDQLSIDARDMGNREDAAYWECLGTGLIAFGIFSVLVDVMLLVGNEKERRGFLVPWLILSWIEMVAVGTIVLIFMLIGFATGALILMIESILPVIFLYVVHKRYAEIKETTGPRIPVPVFKV